MALYYYFEIKNKVQNEENSAKTQHKQSEMLGCYQLPQNILIENSSFKLITAQIIVNQGKENAHFKGIYFINDNFYLIDDLDKDNRELVIPKKHKVTSFLYYLE